MRWFSIFFTFLLASATVAPAQITSPGAAVLTIDKDCNAIQNAVMALKPTSVALQSGTWVVVADDNAAVAMQTNEKMTFANVYKQGNNYAWVQAHEVDSKGTQRATQLCFRQEDGSLERVRQALTISGLDSASAAQAYYSHSGVLVQKTPGFEDRDPIIVKTVKELPFYGVLPTPSP